MHLMATRGDCAQSGATAGGGLRHEPVPPADGEEQRDGQEGAYGGSDPELPPGVSSGELDVCCKVLDAFTESPGSLQGPHMKQLRRRLHRMVALLGPQAHLSTTDYESQRISKKARNRKRQQEREFDKKFINNTALRSGRLQRLEKLKEDHRNAAVGQLLIPDGAVDAPALPTIQHNGFRLTGAPEARESMEVEGQDGTAECSTAKGGPAVEQEGLRNHRSCYTCKKRFTRLHFFYDQLCEECAPLNYAKRMQTADLSGRVAIITGSRVKIGFQTSLKLLRAGATVVATTRFPFDSSKRYAAEADYAGFKERLHVVGLDLRDISSVEAFTQHVSQAFGSVDILINNACQTVRRPASYYTHLVQDEVAYIRTLHSSPGREANPVLAANSTFEAERRRQLLHPEQATRLPALHDSKAAGGAANGSGPLEMIAAVSDNMAAAGPGGAGHTVSMSAIMSQLALLPEDRDCSALPAGARDVNGQQVDLRSSNSWLLTLEEVPIPELIEVMFVNAVSPFVLNSRLLPLMTRGPPADRYIVNVSAMEGKFYRYKTPNHPHTNMAKAALNMMTRTSSEALKERRIFMNAVDTGWINDENPLAKAQKIAQRHNFQTPIDEVDAAARILDPVLHGVNTGENTWGNFLKDYKPSEW